MQQSLGQTQLGQSQQMIQQSSIAQAQQQMAQQQINQSQITQQQIAQSQMAQQQQQQQMAQSQLVQQQQQQMAQQQLAQQQIAQTQMVQQQMAQSQLVQQQLAQSQMAQQQMNQPQIVQQQITQPQMIQQQLSQQQIGQQQLQQMMYCPTVRFVYDTPMQLMQSGDQIQQQNQNIFVNQPPWSRPVQNQVIYVQQIGSNLVPVQHLDPNMFLQQNIPMYQQVVQNVPQLVQNLPQTVQNLPQGQIRQIINNIPAGMVPNFGTNVQRIQEQNLGQMVQNFGLVQPNADISMNNLNLPNNEADRPAISNQANTQLSAPTQELMQVYRQIVPQSNQQQQTRTQAQISQQNNVQNVQTIGQQIVTSIGQNIRPVGNVGINTSSSIGVKGNNARPTTTQVIHNNAPNMNNNIIRTSTNQMINTAGANVGTNMQPVRHIIQTQNVIPQNHHQNMINAPIAPQSYATSVGTLNTVTYSAVRNGQPYTYRAIQPKPNNNNIRVNFKPRGNPMQMVRRPVAPSVPNINQNVPQPTTTSTSTNYTIPTSTNFIKMETENSTFNRKRKSESPDEMHKKISNYGSITVTAQVKDKIKAKYANTSEIGVNTSPVHKMHKVNQNKVENQLPLLQINPMEAKIKQEFLSPTLVSSNSTAVSNNNANNLIKTETGADAKEKKDSKDVSQQTEEKLVRKTVFPQAKATGRLLDAKSGLDMPKLDDVHNVHNNMQNNESVQTLRINDGPKDSTNFSDSNKEIEQISLTNFKQITFNDKMKSDVSKIVKSTLAITTTNTTTTDAIVNTQRNTNTPQTISKPNDAISLKTKLDDTKIKQVPVLPAGALEPKKDILQTSKEVIAESNIMEIELKPESIDLAKLTDKTQIDIIIKRTRKTTEPSKEEVPATEAKTATVEDFVEEIKDNKTEKKEYKNITVNEIKEIHIVDGNIHEEKRDFVLTHVLDGFVIQESNVPFAIRRPLKEKTVNAFVEDKTDPCIKAAKDEIRGQLSQLHLNESREKERLDKETRLKELEAEDSKSNEEEKPATETKIDENDAENDVENDIIMKENPFESLNQNTVKSWTTDDLASHLAKFGWTETVSTLQEHEIDGESLFLVTKTQLVTIGLNEAHAEVICEFVGGKS